MKKSVNKHIDNVHLEGVDKIIASLTSSSSGQQLLTAPVHRIIDDSNIISNKTFALHRNERSASVGKIAKWSPVRYYSVRARKYLDIGQGRDSLKLSFELQCNECDLEIAPFCQLHPHLLPCQKTVNVFSMYDLIVIRSVRTKTLNCRPVI